MYISSGFIERISLWICIVLFSISNIQSQSINEPSIKCPKSELLCGNDICYDPTTQNCTKTKVVECVDECENQCYNSATQQCLNGTICGINEQLCTIKYEPYGSSYYLPYNKCYNPLYEACLNNSVCPYPSGACNNQCLSGSQICVNNTTICYVSRWLALSYKPDQIKLCNGSCYDSAIYKCVGDSVQCISGNCSGRCYNSSTQQCLNETICNLNEQLCSVKYDLIGSVYALPVYECYDPSDQACLNNSVCFYPSRSCNQQCLQYNQVCVDNTTICNVPDWYDDYEPDQIKLCNGKCYDSAIQQCIGGSVQCISGNCSGRCYNSSKQCLNGTICNLNEQVCELKYELNRYHCYDPSSQACLNNLMCDYPSRSCNQQCLWNDQICVNNITICDVIGTYTNYQANQIELCNGVCYNSTIQQCVDEYIVRCIRDPSLQRCGTSSGKNETPFILLISILTVICSILNF